MSNQNKVKQAKILVIDDSALQSMIIKKILGGDHSYTIRKNGKEGLEAIREEEFDVIFLDLLMPEFTGFEVLENLPKGKSYPIVVASADKQNTSLEKCMEMGAIAFIKKPFEAKEMQSVFNTILEKQNKKGEKNVTHN